MTNAAENFAQIIKNVKLSKTITIWVIIAIHTALKRASSAREVGQVLAVWHRYERVCPQTAAPKALIKEWNKKLASEQEQSKAEPSMPHGGNGFELGVVAELMPEAFGLCDSYTKFRRNGELPGLYEVSCSEERECEGWNCRHETCECMSYRNRWAVSPGAVTEPQALSYDINRLKNEPTGSFPRKVYTRQRDWAPIGARLPEEWSDLVAAKARRNSSFRSLRQALSTCPIGQVDSVLKAVAKRQEVSLRRVFRHSVPDWRWLYLKSAHRAELERLGKRRKSGDIKSK